MFNAGDLTVKYRLYETSGRTVEVDICQNFPSLWHSLKVSVSIENTHLYYLLSGLHNSQ